MLYDKEISISSKEPFLVIIKTRKFQNDFAISRLKYLIQDCSLNPRDILVFSYAKWGKNRIAEKINESIDELDWRNSDFTTVTEICRDILSEENMTARFEDFYIEEIKEIMGKLQIKYSSKIPSILGRLAWIETQNKRSWNESDYLDVMGSVFNNIKNGIRLYSKENIEYFYFKLLEKIPDKRIWYKGDVIIKVMYLLNGEKIKSKWQNRIKAVVIDRFNLVCPFKFAIIKQICEINRNVFCVGYPSVTSSFDMKRKFLGYFPEAKILELS